MGDSAFIKGRLQLTQKLGEPPRLAIVLHGHANGVEEHKHDDEPIEPLRLDSVPNPEAKSLLCPPEPFAASLRFHF